MIDGRLAGTWTRRILASAVEIVVDRAPQLTKADRAGLDVEAAAFGRFVARDPRVLVKT